ncbi:MAG: MFS transporter [Myxococcales bacterium]|nr:MFS transporter [Myxococcales bacterium]
MPSSAPALEAPLERRVLWLVTLVQLVNVLDFVMVMPLGRDFARALDFPESKLGLIGGAYTLAAAFAGILSSRFLDRADRRTALAVAMAGLVAATAAGGFARDLPSMMATRIIAGAFGGPATSLALAIVADVVPLERRGKAMGIVSAAFPIASVLGVPAAIYAAELGSWRTPFFAVASVGAAVTVFAVQSLPSLRLHLAGERRAATPTLALIRRPEMAMTLAAAGAMTLSVFMIIPYVRSFLQNNHHYPESQIKYLYLVGGLASFATVRLTGPAVDRIGSTPIAVLGTIVLAGCQLVWFLPERALVPAMLVFVAFMCTASLRGVPLSTLSSKLPAPHERAQYMSLQSAMQHLASASGAIGSSWILTTGPDQRILHMDIVVGLSIVLAALMPLLLWRVERRVKARLASAAAAAAAARAAAA